MIKRTGNLPNFPTYDVSASIAMYDLTMLEVHNGILGTVFPSVNACEQKLEIRYLIKKFKLNRHKLHRNYTAGSIKTSKKDVEGAEKKTFDEDKDAATYLA